MSQGKYYNASEVDRLYGQIVPAYQAAFAGEPWNEVSKCADTEPEPRCIGGLSALAIGATCDVCGQCPELPAYSAIELESRFKALADRPAAWYVETTPGNTVTLAALAWKVPLRQLAAEKYPGNDAIARWFEDLPPDTAWLDEVFANRKVSPSGNLRRFGDFVRGLAERLDTDFVAFRTISPQMLAAVKRDFNPRYVRIFEPGRVPDRRYFVLLYIGKEEN